MKIYKNKLVLILSGLTLITSVGLAEAASAGEDLQAQIDRLEKKTKRQIASLKRAVSMDKSKVEVKGFATLGITRSDSRHYSYLNIANNDIQNENNTTSDSKVGLQFTFTPIEDVEFVAQLLSEAKTRWDVEVTWAYLKYQLNPNWSIKAGKMRLPYYLASEYIDVGYAYPWVRPPSEIYSVFIDNYTGAEVGYRFSFADGWVNQLKVFYGNVLESELGNAAGDNAFDFGMKNLRGLEDRLSYGPWMLRASFTEGEFHLTVPFFVTIEERSYRYKVIGLSYDDGKYYASVEKADSDIEKYSANTPYTATLGYNIGKWFPYVTVAKVDDDDQVFGDTRQKSTAVGIRYYLNSNVALKAGVQHFSDFDGTSGQFSSPSRGFPEEIEDSVNVYSFSVNSIF